MLPIWTMRWLAPLLIAGATMGQSGIRERAFGGEAAEPPAELKIVPLDNLSAHHTATTLAQAIMVRPFRVAVDEQTDSLVISSTREGIAKAEDVIAQLAAIRKKRQDEGSSQPKDGESPVETRLIETPFVITDDWLHNVRGAFSDKLTQIHVPADRMLIVRTVASQFPRIEEVVQRTAKLMEPELVKTRDIELSFFVLAAQIGQSAGDAQPRDLPKGLAPVLKALSENGYANPRPVLAPLVVGINEAVGNAFHLSGMSPKCRIMISGEMQRPDSDAGTSVMVRAEVRDLGSEAPGKTLATLFSANTALKMPFGDYVVLAASPWSSNADEAMILIVRATLVGAASAAKG